MRFRKEDFWMDNYKELYQNGNYTKFFPKYDTSRREQLNAVTRFCIYFFILVLIFGIDSRWLYLPVTVAVLVVLLYNINRLDDDSNVKELDKILQLRAEKKAVDKQKIREQMKHDDEDSVSTLDTEDINYTLEAGTADIGTKTEPPKYRRDKLELLYDVDEIDEFNKNTCKKPTTDNPFMNPNITNYNNGDQPVACNSQDEDINEKVKTSFNHNLFRDVGDLWEKGNSQRQFYTMPNTSVPNNQKEFAEWCWKVPKTCKEDQENCLRYENLRWKR